MMQTKQDFVVSTLRRQLAGAQEEVSLETRIADLSLDSLKFMMLVIELQDDSKQITVDVKRIGAVETVRDLVDIVDMP